MELWFSLLSCGFIVWYNKILSNWQMKNFTFKFAIQSIMRSYNFLMRLFLKSIMCGEMGIFCLTRESVIWYNFSGNNLILGIKSKNWFIPFDLVLEEHTNFFKLKMWTKYLLCQPTNINSWILSWHPFNRAEKKLSLSGAYEAPENFAFPI